MKSLKDFDKKIIRNCLEISIAAREEETEEEKEEKKLRLRIEDITRKNRRKETKNGSVYRRAEMENAV